MTHEGPSLSIRLFDENGVVIAFVVIMSLMVSAALILTGGNLFAGAATVAAIALLLLTIYRIEWSLFALIGMVLLFDQFAVPGFEPFTTKIGFFLNLKEHPYLPHIDVGVANLIEIHFLLLLLVWLVVFAANRPSYLVRVCAWGAVLLFYAALAFSFLYGMKQGGDILPALWEIRAFAYLGFLYWFVPQVVRTKEHVIQCLWVIIIAISFKAFQGIFRFVALHFSFGGFALLTNHEDPVFMTTLILFLVALVLFNVQSPQKTALLWLLIPLLFGFFTGQRRAAYAALGVSSIVFVILLPKVQRWMLIRTALPILFLMGVYCAVFWNSESRWASPVRLVKSGFSNDEETAGDRYYSNLYRVFENYNLATTVRRQPAIGIGFGKKYDMPLPLAAIPFPLRDYIPHNQILWLLVKTGAVGYFCFWFFLNCFTFRSAFTFSHLNDPYLKAVCAVITVAIFNQLVVSYYDLQLTYYRNMIYLGTLLGLLTTMKNLGTTDMSGGQSGATARRAGPRYRSESSTVGGKPQPV